MADEMLIPPVDALKGGPIPRNDIKAYSLVPREMKDVRVEGATTTFGIDFSFTSGNPDQTWVMPTLSGATDAIADITATIGEVVTT